eukprot:gene17409-12445_t
MAPSIGQSPFFDIAIPMEDDSDLGLSLWMDEEMSGTSLLVPNYTDAFGKEEEPQPACLPMCFDGPSDLTTLQPTMLTDSLLFDEQLAEYAFPKDFLEGKGDESSPQVGNVGIAPMSNHSLSSRSQRRAKSNRKRPDSETDNEGEPSKKKLVIVLKSGAKEAAAEDERDCRRASGSKKRSSSLAKLVEIYKDQGLTEGQIRFRESMRRETEEQRRSRRLRDAARHRLAYARKKQEKQRQEANNMSHSLQHPDSSDHHCSSSNASSDEIELGQ